MMGEPSASSGSAYVLYQQQQNVIFSINLHFLPLTPYPPLLVKVGLDVDMVHNIICDQMSWSDINFSKITFSELKEQHNTILHC